MHKILCKTPEDKMRFMADLYSPSYKYKILQDTLFIHFKSEVLRFSLTNLNIPALYC